MMRRRSANFYSENFIAAGPSGSIAFKNDKKFLTWLKQVQKFNYQSGLQDMRVNKISSSPIGEFYTQAKVRWAARFKKTKKELVKFEITYVLYHPTENLKIVMYISHEDPGELMKKKQIL